MRFYFSILYIIITPKKQKAHVILKINIKYLCMVAYFCHQLSDIISLCWLASCQIIMSMCHTKIITTSCLISCFYGKLMLLTVIYLSTCILHVVIIFWEVDIMIWQVVIIYIKSDKICWIVRCQVNLSDNDMDLSDNDVNLSDLYVDMSDVMLMLCWLVLYICCYLNSNNWARTFVL